MKEIILNVSEDFLKILEKEADLSAQEMEQLIQKKLHDTTNQGVLVNDFGDSLDSLKSFLLRVPSVSNVSTSMEDKSPYWWVKFALDIRSQLAWNVVQEFGHVLNYLSTEERLPVKFYPVSPPPYMNGGPEDYLTWIIEPNIPYVDPAFIQSYLEGRLPDPVEDTDEWTD